MNSELLQLAKQNGKEMSDNLKKLIDRIDEATEGSASNAE